MRITTSTLTLGVVFAAALVCTSLAQAQQQTSDARFISGLRDRQLYALAESYCIQALERADLSVEKRADLVVQLSQTLVDHARQTPPPGDEPLWTEAVQTASRFVESHPESSWSAVVNTQAALVLLARGELLRQKAEVAGGNPRLLGEARGYLRLAIRQLRELDETAKELLRRRGVQEEGELDRAELLSLQKSIRFELGRAYRNQGQSYPPHSADRDNAMRQAIEIQSQLAQLSTVDPLAWDARLEEILCYRLMKDLPAAARRLEAIDGQDPPPDVQLRARAEAVRLLLAADKLSAALAVLEQGRTIVGELSPEFDLAFLEAQLAGWRTATEAGQTQEAQAFQQRAVQITKEIAATHAPYWARRAESLLASTVTGSSLTGELALLVKSAQSAFRAGKVDDALKIYDQAAAEALRLRELEHSFDLAYTAATIEMERQNYAGAKERYRQLALKLPEHSKAGEAHLLAVISAAQEAQLSQPVRLDEYQALLLEHLEKWPSGSSSNDARWYLGRLWQHQGKFQQAIETLHGISASHPRYAESVLQAAAAYDSWLATLRAQGQPTRDVALAAAAYFERLILGSDNRWPERWSATELSAATAAARLRLVYTGAEFNRVQTILEMAIQGARDASGEWTATARGLLVFALAGGGKFDQAGQVLQQINAGPPESLLPVLEGLSDLAGEASSDVRARLATLQLQTAQLLAQRRGELDAAQQTRFDVLYAEALAAAGKTAEALKLYDALAAAHPRDADIQEGHALLLSGSDEKPQLEQALDRWRDLARKSKAATPRWFRAKYHLASTYEKLGNPQQAAKIITVTQVLQPDLGGPELKAQFLALLKRCQE